MKMQRLVNLTSVFSLVALLLGPSFGVNAQGASALIEEVLVTAQKKGIAESVQDTPVAITALSGDQIEASFATDITQIGLMAPNVTLQSSGTIPGTGNFSIRGAGNNDSLPSIEPTVSVVMDGMVLGNTFGIETDVFDLEAVEILRGPQGTLFGRNATGGAVILRSRRPSGEFDLRARTSYGTADNIGAAISVEGPLSEELAAKLTVKYDTRDGYFDTAPTSLVDAEDIGAREQVFIRPIISWNPTEDLEITLIGEYSDRDIDGTTPQSFNFVVPGVAVGGEDNFELSHDTQPDGSIKAGHIVAEIN